MKSQAQGAVCTAGRWLLQKWQQQAGLLPWDCWAGSRIRPPGLVWLLLSLKHISENDREFWQQWAVFLGPEVQHHHPAGGTRGQLGARTLAAQARPDLAHQSELDSPQGERPDEGD